MVHMPRFSRRLQWAKLAAAAVIDSRWLRRVVACGLSSSLIYRTCAMSTPVLFPEIWSNILQFVPLFEQGKLLQVSRLFHDIAVPLVFSEIKIYFIGGDGAYTFLSTTHDEFKEEVTSKLMTQSYQLLRRITTDPSFAWIVKSVTVISSSDSESLFERCKCTNVL